MAPPVTVEVIAIATCDCDNVKSNLTLCSCFYCERFISALLLLLKKLIVFVNLKQNIITLFYLIILRFNNDVKRKEKKLLTQNRPETLNKMEFCSRTRTSGTQ